MGVLARDPELEGQLCNARLVAESRENAAIFTISKGGIYELVDSDREHDHHRDGNGCADSNSYSSDLNANVNPSEDCALRRTFHRVVEDLLPKFIGRNLSVLPRAVLGDRRCSDRD